MKKIDPTVLSIAFTHKDLCTRCGTCVGVCPELALSVGKDFHPELDAEKCTQCKLCSQTCPGGEVNFKELAKISFGDGNHETDLFDGHVSKTFVGYSTDATIRSGGAGGGIITALLWDLLKRKAVDGCVVTRMSRSTPYYGEVFIARTYEELLQSQQSKYIVIPVNSILKEIRNTDERFAVAALPCQIHGLRLMQKMKVPAMEKIKVVIGLFCAASMEPFVAIEMLKMKNLKPNEIIKFNFREGEWPGNIIATLKNGDKIRMHHFDYKDGAIIYMSHLYSPVRCQTCIDGSSEFSDLSVSDAWTRDEFGNYLFRSQSKVMARTQNGINVINDAIQAEAIKVEDVTTNRHYKTHKLHRIKKGLKTPLRVERLGRKGVPVPIYDRKPPKASLKESIGERLETFIMTCGHYRNIRYPLYKFLISSWGIPIIKIRQCLKRKKYRRKD